MVRVSSIGIPNFGRLLRDPPRTVVRALPDVCATRICSTSQTRIARFCTATWRFAFAAVHALFRRFTYSPITPAVVIDAGVAELHAARARGERTSRAPRSCARPRRCAARSEAHAGAAARAVVRRRHRLTLKRQPRPPPRARAQYSIAAADHAAHRFPRIRLGEAGRFHPARTRSSRRARAALGERHAGPVPSARGSGCRNHSSHFSPTAPEPGK